MIYDTKINYLEKVDKKAIECLHVGSVHYGDNKYEWALQPIIVKITSSDTSYDYSDGLPVNYEWHENSRDELLPLGDKNEFMFQKAIELITGIRSTASRALKQSVQFNGDLIYKSIDRHQTNGVLLAPEYTRDMFWNN